MAAAVGTVAAAVIAVTVMLSMVLGWKNRAMALMLIAVAVVAMIAPHSLQPLLPELERFFRESTAARPAVW